MARKAPPQDDQNLPRAALPVTGGSYVTGDDGTLTQTERLKESHVRPRRGFGEPEAAVTTDQPKE